MKEYPMRVELEQAIQIIREKVAVMGTEIVPLSEARGRILARQIVAEENVPPFDRSPYDGFAFRAKDLEEASKEHPVTLRIIEEVPAGKAPERKIGKGEAIKILTGAPIPEGADAVERYEVTEFNEKEVTFFEPVKSGSNICLAGEDIRQGEVLMEVGTKLENARLGLLAALGYFEISCYRKIRCVIISTGSELVPVDHPLIPGKIRNSSAYMIQAVLREWGMECDIYGIVSDNSSHIAGAIDVCAQKYDVILTTGGVSVGDYDFLNTSLEELGAEILLWKVKMKPGMAFVAAMHKEKLVLALSGNPSAAAATLYLIGGAVLSYMSGKRGLPWEKIKVRMYHDFPKLSKGRRFIPGRLCVKDGEAYLDSCVAQGNGILSSWHSCNVIGEIPAGTPPLKAGSIIEGYYFV
ncbi:MAG: molybdopterin molybdotransferase MoeA [Lachnospiraceae bacterium]|nr:molybdopterin molybdotransferase MoeA [Lachnospiraceae bacterium]